MTRASICLAAFAIGLALTPPGRCLNPATWTIQTETSGNDVSWMAPTAVDPGFPRYDWSYEFTRAEVFTFLGGTDITELIGEGATGSGSTTGLPILVVDEMLSDDVTGSTADIRVEVDEQGFGQASVTNVVLGSVFLIPIRRAEVDVSVTIQGIPGPPGDYNNDGTVTAADYEVWQSDLGSTIELTADGNLNQIVDESDYTVWRDNLGATVLDFGNVTTSATVPEPTSGLIATCTALLVLAPGSRRPTRSSVRLTSRE